MTTAAIPTEEARQVTPLANDLGARFAVEFDDSGEEMLNDGTHRYRRVAFALFFVYMAVAVGIYLWRGVWFTPDRWAVFLLIGALLLGRVGSFLRDWIPFVLLIFGYEYLRGIAGEIVVGGQPVWELPRNSMPAVRLEGLIRFDEVLFFGHSPILLIQQQIYDPGNPRWWDFLALVVYSMHFVLPCVFAFALWLTSKRRFWTFTLAFCFMTYTAFAFFLLYPAAPPWLAQAWDVASGIGFPQNHVFNVIQPHGFETLDTYAIWGNASPHPVAAMPSLHAAFPWLVMLFAVRYYGWKGLWFLLYNVALWYAVLYTANHWFVDVLAGIGWASVAFFVVVGALAMFEQHPKWRARLPWAPIGRRRAVTEATLGG
ncbi:MAG TPA: phosphatase PAP2 family protein [Thermomicrobiales bacterium]|nr:phosphatase PAP2 family protein [Thermomicrobiales bacterium]